MYYNDKIFSHVPTKAELMEEAACEAAKVNHKFKAEYIIRDK